jgi:hypothetical protein
MDRKPVFLQGMYMWFAMQKTNGLSLEEQQDQSPEVLSDEMIREMNRIQGRSLDPMGVVQCLHKEEAMKLLREAASALT